MKKIQLPAIGGIRKVIQPGANVTAGTTIAELGANTITLAQLAALITQIQGQQQNTGGGNIIGPAAPGGGNAGAAIKLGPGLSGGGVLTGNVPIFLTAPIPWGLDDGGGGGDGDPGPPGAAGVAGTAGAPGLVGAQGPAGAAIFLEAEQGEDGLWAVPGPVGPTGAVGATGAQGPSGSGTGGGAGTLMFWVPEENWPDDPTYSMPSQLGPLAINGAVGITGSTTVVGTETISGGNLVFSSASASSNITFQGGSAQIQAPAAGAVLALSANATGAINMGVSNTQNVVVNSNGSMVLAHGTVQQLLVAPGAATVPAIVTQAGADATNFNSIWKTNGAVQMMALFGDGGLTIGPSTLTDMTTGTVNVSNGYFVKGVPLARAIGAGFSAHLLGDGDNYNDDQGFFVPNPTNVGPLTVASQFSIQGATPASATANQTDMGNSTTGTVITTAGGISLPALAVTFWRVNVNGVAYGVPLFAL
jgi:hypothetical protein